MSVLYKLTYRLKAFRIKKPASYFVDTDTLVLKFTWRGKRPRIANSVLKENIVKQLTYLSSKVIINLQ